jgi:hypothetical protein
VLVEELCRAEDAVVYVVGKNSQRASVPLAIRAAFKVSIVALVNSPKPIDSMIGKATALHASDIPAMVR